MPLIEVDTRRAKDHANGACRPRIWRGQTLHCLLLLVLMLSNGVLWLWLAFPLQRPTVPLELVQPSCNPSTAGAIFFDSVEKQFKGCDGSYWSSLAFCCAPGRPDPPRLSREEEEWETTHPEWTHGSSLQLSWSAPEARGSPVSAYSVSRGLLNVSAGGATTWVEVCRGAALSCSVHGIDPSARYSFVLTAYAAGGTSEPSEPAELQARALGTIVENRSIVRSLFRALEQSPVELIDGARITGCR